MTAKRVLSVGQCMADHGAISRTLQRHFGAEIEAVDTAADALARLRQEVYNLVLVNRVGDADGASGVSLVEQLKADEALRAIPVMLVSNYEDAQREAVQAGALPGFGKAALGQPHMLARLAPLLQLTPPGP
jgi:two-component system, chemotaxis family, chemotaxis protein CheY